MIESSISHVLEMAQNLSSHGISTPERDTDTLFLLPSHLLPFAFPPAPVRGPGDCTYLTLAKTQSDETPSRIRVWGDGPAGGSRAGSESPSTEEAKVPCA